MTEEELKEYGITALNDGLTLEKIKDKYSWVLMPKIKYAILGEADDKLVWYGGEWKGGTWKGGIWLSGQWKKGIWNNGVWYGGVWSGGIWQSGAWVGGVWRSGVWASGIWYGGVWRDGMWLTGEWYDGKWHKKQRQIFTMSETTKKKIKSKGDLNNRIKQLF